jgi:hypothetical protein
MMMGPIYSEGCLLRCQGTPDLIGQVYISGSMPEVNALDLARRITAALVICQGYTTSELEASATRRKRLTPTGDRNPRAETMELPRFDSGPETDDPSREP